MNSEKKIQVTSGSKERITIVKLPSSCLQGFRQSQKFDSVVDRSQMKSDVKIVPGPNMCWYWPRTKAPAGH